MKDAPGAPEAPAGTPGHTRHELHGPLAGERNPPKHDKAVQPGAHNLPAEGGVRIREKPIEHRLDTCAVGGDNPHVHQHVEPGAGAMRMEAAPVHHEAPHHEAPTRIEAPPHREGFPAR